MFAAAVLTGVLIWGLRLLSDVLNQPTGADAKSKVVSRMLAEKPIKQQGPATSLVPSFSRVTGAPGATVIGAFFVGVSYWALFGLFFGKNLGNLDKVGALVVSGTAFFARYAFNQLRAVFSRPSRARCVWCRC